jgi:HSP20 family protein
MAMKDIIPFGEKDLHPKQVEMDSFNSLKRQFDDMFERFLFRADFRPLDSRHAGFDPRIDVVENEREMKLTAELPGMEEKDIDITINRDSLTLSGEKKEEQETKSNGYYRMERSFGRFTRVIPLSSEVDQNKVKATFNKGVLTVTLPKTERAIKETKKISVKSV